MDSRKIESSSKFILDHLRESLEDIPNPPIASKVKFGGELYTRCHRVYREVTTNTVETYCSYLSEQICGALRKQGKGQAVNVCSVGCGDGEADYKILSNVCQAFPTAVLNFVGIDTNGESCVRAKELLSLLPPSCKINVLKESILEIDTESLPKFDIVIMAHVHYYFTDNLLALFTKGLELCRPQTGRVQVIATNHVSLWQLCAIFKNYNDEGPTQIHVSLLLKELESFGMSYITHDLPAKAHCDALFGPNSSQSNEADAEAFLMFICQQDLKAYPPSIASLCTAYVKSCLDQEGRCDCSCTAITLPTPHM